MKLQSLLQTLAVICILVLGTVVAQPVKTQAQDRWCVDAGLSPFHCQLLQDRFGYGKRADLEHQKPGRPPPFVQQTFADYMADRFCQTGWFCLRPPKTGNNNFVDYPDKNSYKFDELEKE